MDNSRLYYNQNSQVQGQSAAENSDESDQVDRAVEDMVQYVRQVGRLNQANRQLVAGIERAKFIKTS